MSSFIELVKKEIYRFMSVWVQTIVGPLFTAILYQLIFGHQFSHVSTGITGVNYATFLIPGLAMMQILLNSFDNVSSSLLQSKYTGNIIFILMAPLTPLTIYLSYLTASVIRGLLVGCAVLIGISWFGLTLPKVWWAVVYFAICGSVMMAGLGLIMGIICNRWDQLAGVHSFIIVPLVYLAGVFFNTHNIPSPWQKIAVFDPFLYIIDGFRYGFIGHSSYNMINSALFILMFTLIINTCGYLLMKSGIRIKQ